MRVINAYLGTCNGNGRDQIRKDSEGVCTMTQFTWTLRSLGRYTRSGSVYTRIERLLLDMTTVLCRLCQTSSLSDAAVSLFSPIAKQQRLPDRITDLLDVETGSQRAGGREISSDRCRGSQWVH